MNKYIANFSIKSKSIVTVRFEDIENTFRSDDIVIAKKQMGVYLNGLGIDFKDLVVSNVDNSELLVQYWNENYITNKSKFEKDGLVYFDYEERMWAQVGDNTVVLFFYVGLHLEIEVFDFVDFEGENSSFCDLITRIEEEVNNLKEYDKNNK